MYEQDHNPLEEAESVEALEERLQQAEEALQRLTAERDRKRRLAELEAQIEAVKNEGQLKPVVTIPKQAVYALQQLPEDHQLLKKFLRENIEGQLKRLGTPIREGREGNAWKIDSAVQSAFAYIVFLREEYPHLNEYGKKTMPQQKAALLRRSVGSLDRRIQLPFNIGE